tara:strand:+ start:147 stop:986 length:840 start_codon:yes stop_codon:yes gene_type:complete
MKLNKIFIISLIYITFTYTQFTEVFVNVEYSNVSANELFFVENLEQEIESYFINNYFFDDADELNIELDINMIIENINTKGGEKIITAQMLFSNKKDNHLFSKSFDFTYQKNEALYKSEMFHPLASLLNYYAYLHIAYELDGYQYLGGNQYLVKAQNIASDGKGSLYPKNWQSRLKKLRREQENYTYRDLKYNFFTAYDILEKDITNIKEGYKFYQNFYQTLIEYDEYYGYSKPLTHFLSAYNQEIVRIAQILNFDEIIDFLLLFDSDNQHIYQQYYEN